VPRTGTSAAPTAGHRDLLEVRDTAASALADTDAGLDRRPDTRAATESPAWNPHGRPVCGKPSWRAIA